ncbi:hypothetical protein [Pengzhenrongella phosphoraccumulans]|uniref:hypothetical protein n=1 Tax=Pengzhenrongella phosphoraccumulans TaxID=3114394 RepID=UPI00388FD34A
MSLNDVSSDPAASTHASDVARERTGPEHTARPKRRRVIRLGVGDATPSRSVDDANRGWHESASDQTNDAQLQRDVPPHW